MTEVQQIIQESDNDMYNHLAELMEQPEFEIKREEWFYDIRNLSNKHFNKTQYNKMISVIKCLKNDIDYPETASDFVDIFLNKFPNGTYNQLIVFAEKCGLTFKNIYYRVAFDNRQSVKVPSSPMDNQMLGFIQYLNENNLTGWHKAEELYDLYKQWKPRGYMMISQTYFGRLVKGLENFGNGILISSQGYNSKLNLEYKRTNTNVEYRVVVE